MIEFEEYQPHSSRSRQSKIELKADEPIHEPTPTKSNFTLEIKKGVKQAKQTKQNFKKNIQIEINDDSQEVN